MKRIAKPNFKRAKRFREDLVALNRPIQFGLAILDAWKNLMYDSHYNIWIHIFPNLTLLFTDTDYLAYEVVGHDLYAGMADIKGEFDFPEYPKVK